MKILPETIDALLPQTQCQQCGYKGCLPYSKAIIENNEQINKCVPGGLATLHALGQLLNRDINPLTNELLQKTKPTMVAHIIEDQCIGCTKCIQACPVDAIIGSAKQMHSVFTDECTGCELCLEPCPVDCIELRLAVEMPEDVSDFDLRRQRYNRRQIRLEKIAQKKLLKKQEDAITARKNYIAEALLRVQAKK